MEDSDFEIGDEVVINATGQKAEVKDFTRDGKVIVTLDSSGRDVTLSEDDIDAWSDLDHGKGQDDGDEDDGEGNVAQDEFYVAVYDEREERSWIGMVTKRSGTKWHEKPFKGKPDYRWGSSYMSYLEPEQVMQWIRKDYARGYDIEGPFASATEAQEYVSNHFGGDMDGQAEVNESGWLKQGIGTKRDVRLDEVRGAMVEAELGWLSASLNEGRTKNPDGTYTDSHTGRRYKGPTGNDGNDSYMDDDYMRKFYTDRLAKIEAGPYKYPKEVAQIKAKLAKLGVKESVDSGTDKQWEMLIGSNKTKRFLAKDVAEATRIARKAGATSVIRLSKNLTRIGLPIKLKESSQIAQEALTMGGALKRALSKPEPGSKLDMKIKKHNSLVSSGQKGLFDTPPDGFKFKKDGTLTLEGVVDVVKKGIKSVKRGMSGWDKNSVGPGGEKTADPVDIVKRNKSYDDETVLRLAKTADFGFPFGKDGKSGDKTPRGLQRKVLDREIKKRGLDVKEGKDFGDFEEWKKAVLLAYPTQANKMKFKGRIEGGKQTVSAEVPGEDRSYGVWDMDEENGVVLSEGASPFKPNVKVKIVGGPADVRGKEGYIGEIKTDVQGKKTFVIDISDGSAKATQSVTLQPKDVRLVKKVKESVTIEAGWLKEAFAKK